MRKAHRAIAFTVVLGLLLAACGEPTVPLDVPVRAAGQQVLDLANILDADDPELVQLVQDLAGTGWDVVLITFEDDDASLGLTDRVGRKVLDAWQADVALVAVAEPGDFTAVGSGRHRFFGLSASEVRAISGGLRERIAEELAPPIAANNEWTEVFRMAMRELLAARSDD